MTNFQLSVKLVELLLILVGSAAVASATCEDAICPRFYNADCQDSHCSNPPCDPHFFWRGKNVTRRCDAETCDTKACPFGRRCIHEIITVSCSAPICRQHLKARCALVTDEPPQSCNDIRCRPDEVCRLRERPNRPNHVLKCVKIQSLSSCKNIYCMPGFDCVDEGKSIRCIESSATAAATIASNTTMASTTVEPTTTAAITAAPITEVPFTPTTAEDVCANFSCPQNQPCTAFSIPSAPYIPATARCSTNLDSIFALIATCSPFSCFGFPCIEAEQNGRIVNRHCSGCDELEFCQFNQQCTPLPTSLRSVLNISALCLPNGVTPEFGLDCSSKKSTCIGPDSYCTEAKFEDTVVASYCSDIPLYPSCDGVTCNSETSCIQARSSAGQYAFCSNPGDLGLVPTTTESSTTEPTTSEPTTFANFTSPPTPAVLLGFTCNDLNCPDSFPVCELLQVPEINVTIAGCALESSPTILMELATRNLNNTCQFQPCLEDEVCVDFFGELTDGGTFCSRINCSIYDDTSCPYSSRCIELPTNFMSLPAASACIPEDVDIYFDLDCTSNSSLMCEPGFTCAEAALEGQSIGSFCTTIATAGTTCDRIVCQEEDVCIQTTYESTPGFYFSQCINESDILSILEILQNFQTCQTLVCNEGEKCVTAPETGAGTCVSDEPCGGPCSSGQVCSIVSIPSHPNTPPVSMCFFDRNQSLQLNNQFSCANLGSQLCRSSPCIDTKQGERQVNSFCAECEDGPSSCLFSDCTKLPSNLMTQFNISSACLPNDELEFGKDCRSRVEPCVGPFSYCVEGILEKSVLFSYCSFSNFSPTCEDVTCESGYVCAVIDSGGLQYANCELAFLFGL